MLLDSLLMSLNYIGEQLTYAENSEIPLQQYASLSNCLQTNSNDNFHRQDLLQAIAK